MPNSPIISRYLNDKNDITNKNIKYFYNIDSNNYNSNSNINIDDCIDVNNIDITIDKNNE